MGPATVVHRVIPTSPSMATTRTKAALGGLIALALAGCSGPEEPPEPEVVRLWRRPPIAEPTLDATTLLGVRRPGAYILGPGDVLQVSVLDLLALDQKYSEVIELDTDGDITLPVVGRLNASGKTVGGVRQVVVDRLKERVLDDPQVTVTVQEYRSKEIAVLGAVMNPGPVALRANETTVLGALALAGGLVEKSSLKARLIRGSGMSGPETPAQVDLDLEALRAGDLRQNVALFPGDVLQVLPVDRYFVTGWVTSPGEYPFQRGTTVMEAVAIAGGMVWPDASPDLTRIHRPGQAAIPIDYDAIVEGEAPDVLLRPGDVIEVRQGVFRGVALFVGRFLQRGVIFAYNLADLVD